MNRGPYGIVSMICSANNGLPDTISRSDFDGILMGKGKVRTAETCKKKWAMMIDLGWFVPSGKDVCRIDQDALTDAMIKYRVDIEYDGDDRYQNESLLQNLLKRHVDVDNSVHYDD